MPRVLEVVCIAPSETVETSMFLTSSLGAKCPFCKEVSELPKALLDLVLKEVEKRNKLLARRTGSDMKEYESLRWVVEFCGKCADNDGDPSYRCLEHRDRRVQPKSRESYSVKLLWDFEETAYTPMSSIKDKEYADPNQTIEGRHRHAARRSGAVDYSYRKR